MLSFLNNTFVSVLNPQAPDILAMHQDKRPEREIIDIGVRYVQSLACDDARKDWVQAQMLGALDNPDQERIYSTIAEIAGIYEDRQREDCGLRDGVLFRSFIKDAQSQDEGTEPVCEDNERLPEMI